MMCNHCTGVVEKLLLSMGCDSVETNLEEKYAIVNGCEITDSKIIDNIVNAGYKVVGIEEL